VSDGFGVPRLASCGVIASFGLVLDLIGFVLLLFVVLVSSVILFVRGDRTAARGPCNPDRDSQTLHRFGSGAV
jgi:hypothetical protein